MNRYVRRGSKEIALLDPTDDTLRLIYVFDVSDTGGRSHVLSGADNSNQIHDGKGIVYSRRENDDKLLLNWSKVAKPIDYLISIDFYMTTEEKENFETMKREKAGIVETPSVSDATEPIEQPIDSIPILNPENPEQGLKQEEITQEMTQETIPILYSKANVLLPRNCLILMVYIVITKSPEN